MQAILLCCLPNNSYACCGSCVFNRPTQASVSLFSTFLTDQSAGFEPQFLWPEDHHQGPSSNHVLRQFSLFSLISIISEEEGKAENFVGFLSDYAFKSGVSQRNGTAKKNLLDLGENKQMMSKKTACIKPCISVTMDHFSPGRHPNMFVENYLKQYDLCTSWLMVLCKFRVLIYASPFFLEEGSSESSAR